MSRPTGNDVVGDATERIEAGAQLGRDDCLGLLEPDEAAKLAAGDLNHNVHMVETSPRCSAEITSTHSFEDWSETLEAANTAGLTRCSGITVGMSETPTASTRRSNSERSVSMCSR